MAPLSVLLFITLLSISSSQTAKATNQILLTLTHTLSHSPNSTTHHLLKASAARSAARHQQRRQVSLPLSPGSDYTLSLSLSTSTTVNLYMDTGSDLVWFPCSPFECILCDGKPPLSPSPPPPPPPTSTPLSCASSFCSAAHSRAPSSDLCAAASCPLDAIETSSCHSPCPAFYYAYGDGSLIAHLRRGPLSLTSGGGQDNMVRLDHFTFACAHSTLAEPIGVAGFGGGLLSLPAQLGTLHPGLGGRFSYCLVSHAFSADRLVRPSPLTLGRADEPERFTYTYTPMLHNPKHPYFYSVGLEAVTIGQSRIPAGRQLSTVDRSGNGGMVVDSGTTFTMLPSGLHARLSSVFDRMMNQTGFARAVGVERETGLGPCYWYQGGDDDARRVPGLALHFAGNASIVLPRRNYFMGFAHGGRRAGCFMMMDGGDEAVDGPAATMGNYQQQGFEVVYDLEGRRVGFARRPCAAMWDEVSRG